MLHIYPQKIKGLAERLGDGLICECHIRTNADFACLDLFSESQ
jgi:hypothetical protein